jgi:hypothetical protein
MSSEQWIVVPEWDKFQHYSDRDPLWIKVYTRLLHDDAWLSLTDAEKGFLCTVWLEFASTGGQIRVGRVPSSVRPVRIKRTLERLSNAGFIELSASKPLALAHSREKILREEKKESAGASERAVDNSSRPRQNKNPDAYRRAENMTRNAGWQYEPVDFLAELEKFDLDPGQRHDLEQLRLSLINGADPDLDW